MTDTLARSRCSEVNADDHSLTFSSLCLLTNTLFRGVVEWMQMDKEWATRKCLLQGVCFWGSGEEIEALSDEENEGANCCPFTPAWWNDFWYYECNYNPGFALFFVDKQNPLKQVGEEGEMAMIFVRAMCADVCVSTCMPLISESA
jgi:hypothetical protein